MKGKVEICFYLSIGLGMAMATSAYTMISDLFVTASAALDEGVLIFV